MEASIVQKDDNLQEAGEVSQTFFVAPNGDNIRGDGTMEAEPRQAGLLFFAGNVVYHNCLSNQKRNMPSGWPSAVNLTHRGDIVVGNSIYENYGEGLGVYGNGHHVADNDLHDNFGVE